MIKFLFLLFIVFIIFMILSKIKPISFIFDKVKEYIIKLYQFVDKTDKINIDKS